ncbi:MAG: ATP-grasp domain-containing protein [Eubacteriales bacterium]|nr:ATP-grasp domain-containing protein [Eubacteriales bacterium]
MKTILLTAVGSASASAALASYRAAGHRVCGCDIYPREWNVTSCEVDAFDQVPLATDTEAYVSALAAIVKKAKADFLVPLTDVEVDVLCARREEFRALGATVCCPDAPVAALCRDKFLMAKMMGAAEVCTVIPTYAPDTLPDSLPFPLLVKPQRGRSSQGLRVVNRPDELASALHARTDCIIQPFLTGDVYTVDCARDERGNFVSLTRRERLRTVNGLGTAVEILPDHPLEAVCRRIAEFAGIVGVVNMEFIHSGNEYYFLEVNPRFSGGIGFSVLAGYDFPSAMLRCHSGQPLEAPPAFRSMTLAQRYEMRITR